MEYTQTDTATESTYTEIDQGKSHETYFKLNVGVDQTARGHATEQGYWMLATGKCWTNTENIAQRRKPAPALCLDSKPSSADHTTENVMKRGASDHARARKATAAQPPRPPPNPPPETVHSGSAEGPTSPGRGPRRRRRRRPGPGARPGSRGETRRTCAASRRESKRCAGSGPRQGESAKLPVTGGKWRTDRRSSGAAPGGAAP